MAEGINAYKPCWVCDKNKVFWCDKKRLVPHTVSWIVGHIAKATLRGDNKKHDICADCWNSREDRTIQLA